MIIETREVLAGAYLRIDDRRRFLSHAVEIVDGIPARVFCGRVNPENICDASAAPDSIHNVPTCATCARRDPRGNTR